MQPIVKNWRTSLTGLVVIVLGALDTFAGVHVPGFTLDFAGALPVGLGLIFAQDAHAYSGAPKP